MTRMERRKILSEEKHRVKMKKVKKHWVTVGMTTIVGLGVIGLSEGVEASADTWKPTSLEEMKTRVKLEDGKYTFQSGDTFWAIGNAINIKPEKLMELNNFAPGTQYSVPIGTTIYWSGDNVTVKDQAGNVIAQETIKAKDKVNPSLPVGGNSINTTNTNGGNVKGNSSNTNSNNGGSNTNNETNSTVKDEENQGNNNGNQGNGNNGGTTTPSKPNPVPPVNPVDPNKPTPPELTELEKLKAQLAELKAQLEVAKAELSQAQTELENAKAGNTSSKEEIQAKISEQQTIIDTAQATITTKQADLASIESQLAVANTDLNSAQNNLANANQALSTAQSNTATAQQAFDAANTALLADPSNPALQQAVSDTQSALNSAQQQETQAVNNQASAQTAVNTAQSTIDTLNSSKQQATNELSTAQSTLSTAQNEKANLEQQLANAGNTDIPALEAKVEEKKKIVAELEAEIKRVEEKIAELEGKEKPTPPVEVDKSALSNLVNSVKATDTSKYTDDTVSAFTNALANANSVLSNAKATQEQVNTALSNLQSAYNNLAEKSEENKVDKSALQELINSVKDIDLSVYTDESVEKFNTALSTANTVLSNEKATQSQVDSAKSALQNAYDSLNFKPIETVNKNELSNLLDVLSKADLSKYTTDSVEKFNEALSNAYNVFWNNEATQSQVDSAVSALQKAYDNLVEKEDPTPTPVVDKTQLNLVVSEASSIHLDDYTTDSAKALSTALSKAKEVLSNAKATQEQVNTAKDNLRNAIDNLVEKPEVPKVDKSALQSAVDSVSSLKQADYTTASWSKLQTALTNAKAVLDNKDATQSQVDAQVTALNNAKSALVKKANKTALDQAIAKAPTGQGSYTDTSWKALQSALSTAKTISGKEDATQSEVDSATTALNKAINDLKVQKYTLTVIHKDQDGKVLDTEEFEVEKGKNYSAKSKGFEGYELVGEGTKVVSNMQTDGTVIFTYKKKVTEDEKIKEVQEAVGKTASDQWGDYRKQNGKTPSSTQSELQKAADIRAKEIATLFDHTRPNGTDALTGYNPKTGQYEDSIGEEVGYTRIENMEVTRNTFGEVIARVKGVSLEWIEQNGATYAIEAWKASPEHKGILLADDPYTPLNQFAVGTYIEKNEDGTYNVYYCGLNGYDSKL